MLPTPHVSCDYNKVYEPSEDSFLVLDALEKDQPFLTETLGPNSVNLVCEIGCGSGIVTTFMMQNNIPSKYSIYVPTDVNPWALESTVRTAQRNECEQQVFSPVRMNLVHSMRAKEIDLLVFNPPYVPAETVPAIPQDVESSKVTPGEDDPPADWLDLALLGGDDGMVVTWQLLNNLNTFLSANGVAYILFCARNKPQDVARHMQQHGWKAELVEHRKAGWEVLSVYRFHH
ncbi:LAFA_0E04522g1_1 [Lachancea sp. 'fantastica']|nr:LAFA_0E04522g1_1 [Lachancea sp. 'fantastica']